MSRVTCATPQKHGGIFVVMKRLLKIIVGFFLRQKLSDSGHRPARRPLQITPARHGSGLHDVSIEHDRYFADGELEAGHSARRAP
jgi:hypothetical protein